MKKIGRYDPQHNDTQHNDIKHNGTQYNDTQHNDIKHNDTQFNDTQHNSKLKGTLSIMTLSIIAEHCYADCRLCCHLC
jgi:hypothetical protein